MPPGGWPLSTRRHAILSLRSTARGRFLSRVTARHYATTIAVRYRIFEIDAISTFLLRNIGDVGKLITLNRDATL